MNRRSWMVWACVISVVCGEACEINFSMPCPGSGWGSVDRDAGAGTNGMDAGANLRSGDSDAAEQVDASSASVQRDAVADAGGDVVRADASAVPEGMPTDVIATVLSPSQCWGRHLGATNEFTRYARLGMSVWHICYHTALWDAVVPGADPRPAHVSFFRFDPVAHFPIPLAEADAPGSANPWTANVMIAMPPGASFAPYFNLGNVREGGSVPDIIWAVQQNVVGGQLEQNGVIQVWRVDADGSQTFVRPQILCHDRISTASESSAFLIPENVCRAEVPDTEACDLSSCDCRTVPLP